jgi:undecaprenyl-diphosphatase
MALAMSLLEALVLGLVQGLTEFLPISSTAHLRIAPELFGWRDPGAAYSAVIQLGTVAAVVLYFWRDLVKLSVAFIQGLRDRKPFGTVDSRLAWFVLVGTLPIGVMGLLFKKSIESTLRSLYVISASLILLAVVLYLVERAAKHTRTIADMTLSDGVMIGLWQALALIPGSSRSGTTLTGGLSLGLKREDAARFSFLLSVPATALAGIFELKHLIEAPERPSTMALLVGTGVAFVSGMAAIAGLLRYLRTRTTLVFVVYRLGLGVLLLVLLSMGVLKPQSGLPDAPHEPLPPKARQLTD